MMMGELGETGARILNQKVKNERSPFSRKGSMKEKRA